MIKYADFINDRLFESAINESMIYYTKEFKDSLFKLRLKSEIAQALIDVEYTDVKPDMTIIGMSDKDGYFSFTQMAKAVRALKKSADELAKVTSQPDPEKFVNSLSHIWKKIENGETSQSDINFVYNEKPWNLKSKSRTEAKIAKLVNQIFPDKYSNKEIEEFTNLFKNVRKSTEEFELVSGKDIIKWYDVSKYIEESGDLGNSCMRHRKCSSYFGIYTENPDQVKLLILKSEDGESILGRALIWKVDIDIEGVDTYMDRIYAIDDANKARFEEYADTKGWLKRQTSRYGDCMDFTLGDKNFDDYKMTVKLSKWKFDDYPYMDTLKSLIVEDGILINSEDEDSPGRYVMTNTDGSYTDTSGKWSNWFDTRIPEDEAVWSEPLDDWIYRNDSIEVEHGSRRNRGFYPSEYEEIYQDASTNYYIHSNDAEWSEYHDGYILSEDAIYAITWIDVNYSNKNSLDFNESLISDNEAYIYVDKMAAYEYLKEWIDLPIVGNILKKGLNDKYYIGDSLIDVFKTDRGYLTKNDIKFLNLPESNSGPFISDEMAYSLSLSEDVKRDLRKKLNDSKNEIENFLSGKQPQLPFSEDEEMLLGDNYKNAKRHFLNIVKNRINLLDKWS
jgi:hypothetical protein